MNVIEAAGFLSASASDTDEGIKQSWRWSASKWHPDRGGDHEAMQTINAARDYLLSMTADARGREWKQLKSQISGIMELTTAKMETWEARKAANASPESTVPPVTNKKRRAAGWEERNAARVREQTKARVAAHRARKPEQYREFMREYMKQRRAKP